jgi:hypothetical protein
MEVEKNEACLYPVLRGLRFSQVKCSEVHS